MLTATRCGLAGSCWDESVFWYPALLGSDGHLPEDGLYFVHAETNRVIRFLRGI